MKVLAFARVSGLGFIAVVGVVGAIHGCGSGPASIDRVVRPADAVRYQHYLDLHNGQPAAAWLAWRSDETATPVEALREADEALSRTENPFSPDDPLTVQRGALVYSTSCVTCHGPGADGRDASGQALVGRKDFTHSHTRMALKMNPDRLAQWYQVVDRGTIGERPMPDGSTAVMPAMGEQLTREQIWLVLNWLASDHAIESEVKQ